MTRERWIPLGRRARLRVMHAMLATAVGVGAPAVAAQTAERASQKSREPDCRNCLAGHRFLPSSIVGDPFVTTHFASSTGGGAALDLTMPVRNLQGQVIDSLSGDVAFLALGLEYQYAVLRWLALRASASAVGRIGTSAEAVIASGLSAVYGFSLGATARVWERRSFTLALTGDFFRNTVYDVDPYHFVQTVVRDGYSDTTRAVLLSDVVLNRYAIGARGAWAPNAWLGFAALFDFGAADLPSDEAESESVSGYGGEMSLDFGHLWRVPIGLALSARGQAGPGRPGVFSGTVSSYEAGLFYTGRRTFVIGAAITWSNIQVEDPDIPKLRSMHARLVSRFDF